MAEGKFDEELVKKNLEAMAAGHGQLREGEDGVRWEGFSAEGIASGLKYFGNALCPFAHRAYWAMKERGVKVDEYVHIDLGASKPEWYKEKVNPGGTVPCVFKDGVFIGESDIVAELFDDLGTEGDKLIPEDPVVRARLKMFAKVVPNAVLPAYKLLMSKDESKDEELAKLVAEKWGEAEAYYEKHGSRDGPYFLGAKLSIADVLIVPFLERFSATLPYYRKFNPLEGRPRLTALLEAARARPAFKVSTREPEYFIAAYASYAER